MRLQTLQRRRTEQQARLKAIHDVADAENRDLSDDEDKEATDVCVALDRLDREIAYAERLAAIERRQAAVPVPDGRWQDLVRGYSLGRAVAQFLPAAMTAHVDFGREREVQAELERRGYRPHGTGGGVLAPLELFVVERRDITTTTPAAGPGSHLIGTDHLPEQYVDLLRAALILPRVGARTLSGLLGNVSIPAAKKATAVGWFAEGTDIPASDAEFRSITMSPKHVGCIARWSINLLLQSSPDIEMLLRQDFAAQLAEALDKAAVIGSGVAPEPLGVLNQPGIGAVAFAGPPALDPLLAMIQTLQDKNAVMSGWVGPPVFARQAQGIAKFGDGTDTPLMEGPASLLGYPYVSSTNALQATPTIIAGGWSDLLIGYWGALTLLANPFGSPQFEQGGMALRGTLSADVAVRHAESFCKSTGITPPA